ncbi:MAG: TonB-dependent receptor [Gammaproteobacteria bacterium]|nr:TonB-dependent receptor [Gammaproteobacteria bacterium]
MARVDRWRLGIGFSLLGVLWLTFSPTAVARANPESFDIAAQPMPGALQAFAAQAHVQLLFDYKALARLRTGPVKGLMQPNEALALLLKGSGYTFQRVNGRTIAIRPAVAAAADPPPSADSGAAAAAPAAASGGASLIPPQNAGLQAIVVTARFISDAGSSAMRMNLPARDTPFSISTYSQSFVHAVEAQQVASLYPYMTGIQRAGNTGYDIVFRGFTSGANDINSILVDGLPGLATRFGSPATIGVQRIDVVRGPASVINGQEEPGGFINLVTKKPEAQPLYELSASGTAYDGHGIGIGDKPGFDVAGDATGPIAGSDHFLYRLVVDDTNKDTFRSFSYNRSLYLAPSFTWRISDATKLTLAYVYQRVRFSYDTYLVAPNSNIYLVAPITTRYQQPSDYETEQGNVLTSFFDHRFANGFSFHVATRDVWHTDQAHGYDVVNFDTKRPGYLTRRARGQLNRRSNHYIDAHLLMPLDLLGIKQQMLVGVTDGRTMADVNRLQFFNAPSTGPQSLDISIDNPDYNGVPPLSSLPLYATGKGSLLSDRYSVTEEFGAYLADMITFTRHWKASAGLRYSSDKQWTEGLPTVGTPKGSAERVKTNSKPLPMGGIVYQPDEHLSFYASYATSYVPPSPTAIDITGVNSFVPTYAKQYEVGEKDDFLHGRVSSTLALYRIDESDTLTSFACADYGTCYAQVGKAQSKGAEFEVNARPLPSWQLTAGAAYTNARVTESTIAQQVGAREPNVPVMAEHLWSRYQFTTRALRGLGWGLGVIHQGERAGFLPNATSPPLLQLPAYTRIDTALYYDTGDYTFTFKVQNVFDKTYYDSSGFNGGDLNLVPGSPRMFTLSARAYLQ